MSLIQTFASPKFLIWYLRYLTKNLIYFLDLRPCILTSRMKNDEFIHILVKLIFRCKFLIISYVFFGCTVNISQDLLIFWRAPQVIPQFSLNPVSSPVYCWLHVPQFSVCSVIICKVLSFFVFCLDIPGQHTNVLFIHDRT